MCRREDLNLHGLLHTHLKRACIPISTRRQFVIKELCIISQRVAVEGLEPPTAPM